MRLFTYNGGNRGTGVHKVDLPSAGPHCFRCVTLSPHDFNSQAFDLRQKYRDVGNEFCRYT